MKKGAVLVVSALLILWAESAKAERMNWAGTMKLELGNFDPLVMRGGGVASVNASGGGLQLTKLRLNGGISGSATIPISDPDVAGTFPSVRILPKLGTGTMSGFEPIPPTPFPVPGNSSLALGGSVRLCQFVPGCHFSIVLPLSGHDGASGVGVGGSLTVGGFGPTRISIQAAPWTLTGFLPVDTTQGGTNPWVRTGFLHSPGSSSSNLAQEDTVMQLVSPVEVRGNDGLYLPGFATFTLKFVPVPAGWLMLVTGIAAMVGLYRNRIR